MTKLDQVFYDLADSFIGFDTVFRNLDGTKTYKNTSFPPVNIVQDGENIRIEMAVAGYSTDDIDIEYRDGILTVKSAKLTDELNEGERYIHHGIAKRAFERNFTIADTVVVDGASYDNGMLIIHLHNELPEHRKQRKIEIEGSKGNKKLLNE